MIGSSPGLRSADLLCRYTSTFHRRDIGGGPDTCLQFVFAASNAALVARGAVRSICSVVIGRGGLVLRCAQFSPTSCSCVSQFRSVHLVVGDNDACLSFAGLTWAVGIGRLAP